MVQYKLYYFNLRGRAEIVRLVFAAAGQQYEDIRIDREKEWPNLKPKSPTGQVPFLEIVDGDKTVTLSQSIAIARYFARRFNLAGATPEEEVIVDMYVDQNTDYLNEFAVANFREKDETRKKELVHKFETETLPNTFGFFEKRLSQSKSGFLVDSGLTYGDLYISSLLDYLGEKKDAILANFPHLKKMDEQVRAHPRVAEWLAKRPKTDI